ncbi:hypothetical protein NC652_007078 [Populus alba x Populus x berolinensis]|nr:hypothetical protein NC652_007078 [Populus alba x Populus x berolinensis]
MGIGWLLQIRKTWPALGHQPSLEPQKWPRPKMGGEEEIKEKDELVKLHYLLFSSLLLEMEQKWRHNVRVDGSNGTESIYIYGIFRGSEWVTQENRITMQILPKLQVWCNYLCSYISGLVLATQKLGFLFLFLNQMQRSVAIAHLVFGGFQITRQ